jgi:hypothetical protein
VLDTLFFPQKRKMTAEEKKAKGKELRALVSSW